MYILRQNTLIIVPDKCRDSGSSRRNLVGWVGGTAPAQPISKFRTKSRGEVGKWSQLTDWERHLHPPATPSVILQYVSGQGPTSQGCMSRMVSLIYISDVVFSNAHPPPPAVRPKPAAMGKILVRRYVP